MDHKEDWGLVLAGGGGKGAYEIGAWKALRERKDLKISAVSGTSVGALNAALFCTDDFELAEDIWTKQIDQNVILTPDFWHQEDTLKQMQEIIKQNEDWIMELPELKNGGGISSMFSWLFLQKNSPVRKLEKFFDRPLAVSLAQFALQMAQRGVFSREGLIGIIRQNGILSKISQSSIPCYAACYNIGKGKIDYFLLQQKRSREVLHILLASSALPFIFPPEEIYGMKYWDGGLKDNVPVRPLYKAGYRKFLIIHLDEEDHNLFSLTGLFTEKDYLVHKMDPEYRDAVLVHFYPQKSLSGLKGTLDFHPDSIQKKMEQGYIETKKRLATLG